MSLSEGCGSQLSHLQKTWMYWCWEHPPLPAWQSDSLKIALWSVNVLIQQPINEKYEREQTLQIKEKNKRAEELIDQGIKTPVYNENLFLSLQYSFLYFENSIYSLFSKNKCQYDYSSPMSLCVTSTVRGVSDIFRHDDYANKRAHSTSILLNAGYTLAQRPVVEAPLILTVQRLSLTGECAVGWGRETKNKEKIFLDLNLNKS